MQSLFFAIQSFWRPQTINPPGRPVSSLLGASHYRQEKSVNPEAAAWADLKLLMNALLSSHHLH